MTNTMRALGLGRVLAAARLSAATTTPATGPTRAVRPRAKGGRAGRAAFDPLFFIHRLDLAETFSISPYGLA
jgi:hypothetical protein